MRRSDGGRECHTFAFEEKGHAFIEKEGVQTGERTIRKSYPKKKKWKLNRVQPQSRRDARARSKQNLKEKKFHAGSFRKGGIRFASAWYQVEQPQALTFTEE